MPDAPQKNPLALYQAGYWLFKKELFQYQLLVFIQRPALDVSVTFVGELIQSCFNGQTSWSNERTSTIRGVRINVSYTFDATQSRSHGSGAATSSHTWQF